MKLRKIIIPILSLGILIPLSSCEFKLFDNSSSKKEESSKIIDSSIITESSSKEVVASSSKNASSSKIAESSIVASSTNMVSSQTSSIVVQSSDVIRSSSVASAHVPSSSVAESSSTFDINEIKNYLCDYKNYYGYNQLKQIETYGETFASIYDSLYEQAVNFLVSTDDYSTVTINGTEMVTLDDVSYFNTGLDYAMAGSVVMTLVYDNPIFYFLRTGYSGGYMTRNDVVVDNYINLNVSLEYATYDARKAINQSIVNIFKDFSANNDTTSLSDANKAKTINSYIRKRITYAYKSDGTTPEDSCWAHNIEGFVNDNYKKGVCECYAKTYKLLSDYIGLNSIIVTGYTDNNPSNGHAWNYTSVNNKWYGVDVTWNDQASFITKDQYLLVGSNKMAEQPSHTPNGQTYGVKYMVPLPTLETQSYNSSILDLI